MAADLKFQENKKKNWTEASGQLALPYQKKTKKIKKPIKKSNKIK